MKELLAILLIALALSFYFLPTLLSRKHNHNVVFVVNLLFGWTLIGWLIALAIALFPPTKITVNTKDDENSN